MSDSFSLPLRPLREKRVRQDTLPTEIGQINAQWGAFRDVDEASLRAQIEAEKNRGPEDDDERDDKSTADAGSPEYRDLLYKRRADIHQFAQQAHMEALFALDFVSLLLSKNAPRQAETSMSAYLKQVAPLGSLNAEVVNPPPKPETAVKDTKTVSRGWRLQNFDAGASRLLDAATRLEAEVASETRYWEEVLAVKEKGWKVCRLPRDRQALGVQYGFMEATPSFRDRGLAALRRADDGRLVLDKGLAPQKARMTRVRVKSREGISGCSHLQLSMSENMDSIEHRILQARDTLYEEELFHELFREARTMGNQGVTTRPNLVQVPVSDEQEILLDLVDVDADSPPDEPPIHSHDDDTLANAISHSIHILLAYAHRQNLRRRTQPPPPLSTKRRHTPEYHLLRPILTYLQHTSHVRWVESFLQDIHRVLQPAGLQCDFTANPFSSIRLPKQPTLPAVEALAQTFLFPLESTFSGKLASANASFKIRIRTNTSAPPLGTHFDLSVNLPEYPDIQTPSHIGLQEEVANTLTHFIMLDILTAICQNQKSGAARSDKEAQANDQPVPWTAVYPHHGELLALSPTGPNVKLKVALLRHELSVRTYSMRSAQPIDANQEEASQSQTWTPDSESPSLSLLEFVTAISVGNKSLDKV